MRRIVIAVCSTASALVLLFAWPTSTNKAVSTASGSLADGAGTSSSKSTGSGSDATTGTSSSGSSSSGSSSTKKSTSASKTYTGASVQTRYGDVQVRIKVKNGAITSADAIAYPDSNGRDVQISSFAIPVLNADAVAKQSANIDMVSGASYTSQGYAQSLQDAIDQAGL